MCGTPLPSYSPLASSRTSRLRKASSPPSSTAPSTGRTKHERSNSDGADRVRGTATGRTSKRSHVKPGAQFPHRKGSGHVAAPQRLPRAGLRPLCRLPSRPPQSPQRGARPWLFDGRGQRPSTGLPSRAASPREPRGHSRREQRRPRRASPGLCEARPHSPRGAARRAAPGRPLGGRGRRGQRARAEAEPAAAPRGSGPLPGHAEPHASPAARRPPPAGPLSTSLPGRSACGARAPPRGATGRARAHARSRAAGRDGGSAPPQPAAPPAPPPPSAQRAGSGADPRSAGPAG